MPEDKGEHILLGDVAFQAYRKALGPANRSDKVTELSDLIADLHHLADHEGQDFDVALDYAEDTYQSDLKRIGG